MKQPFLEHHSLNPQFHHAWKSLTPFLPIKLQLTRHTHKYNKSNFQGVHHFQTHTDLILHLPVYESMDWFERKPSVVPQIWCVKTWKTQKKTWFSVSIRLSLKPIYIFSMSRYEVCFSIEYLLPSSLSALSGHAIVPWRPWSVRKAVLSLQNAQWCPMMPSHSLISVSKKETNPDTTRSNQICHPILFLSSMEWRLNKPKKS